MNLGGREPRKGREDMVRNSYNVTCRTYDLDESEYIGKNTCFKVNAESEEQAIEIYKGIIRESLSICDAKYLVSEGGKSIIDTSMRLEYKDFKASSNS